MTVSVMTANRTVDEKHIREISTRKGLEEADYRRKKVDSVGEIDCFFTLGGLDSVPGLGVPG